MILATIKRDLTLALRSGGSWLHGILFFGVFISLSAIALGGSLDIMRPLAPALIWLAVVFSSMLSFPVIFQEDYNDGNLAQLKLAGQSLIKISAVKAISFGLISILPLLAAIPFASLLFDLPAQTNIAVLSSLIVSAPALIIYGVLASAILVGRKGGGFLVVLLTSPFLIPLLIFGLGAVTAFPSRGLAALEFRALLGLSLVAIAVGLPAASAALRTNLE